jgi:hypothetical protein
MEKFAIALYTNGVRYAPSGAKLQINTNGVKPSAWEEQNCRYYVTCTWITEQNPSCSNTYYSSTDGNEWCYEPESTIGGCYYYWRLVSSVFDRECDMIWVPDPPDGGGGGDGGGGNGDGGSNTDDLTFEFDETLKIREDSLRKYYPCATKLVIDSLLKIQDYANLVQPFTTDLKPDLVWESSAQPWGGSGNNGIYELGVTTPSTLGIGSSATISLNTFMLQNSSQLLIAAASIHETMHAYINFGVANAEYNQSNGFMTTGSWLYGLDSWYNIHGLPTNFSNHYVMIDFYFDKAVSVLAEWDHNGHSLKEYRMAMLYGLNNPGTGVSTSQQNILTAEYNRLLTRGDTIKITDLNTFYGNHLNAAQTAKLPTTGCN